MKKRTLILYLLLSLIIGLFIGGVGGAFSFYHHFFADGSTHKIKGSYHMQRFFKRIDHNPKDGMLSLKEQQEFGEKTFSFLDDDENGLLTSAELPKHYFKGWAKHFLVALRERKQLSKEEFIQLLTLFFEQQDSNQDQLISLDEIEQGLKKQIFKKLDKDQNGSLSFEEFFAHTSSKHHHHKHLKKHFQ